MKVLHYRALNAVGITVGGGVNAMFVLFYVFMYIIKNSCEIRITANNSYNYNSPKRRLAVVKL